MSGINPLLLSIPMPIITPRLLLRPYTETDGSALTEAFLESINELKQWMPWAQEDDREHPEGSELIFIRNAIAQWQLRETLNMLIVDKNNPQKVIGAVGFRTINWTIPKMEIGYWLRTSMTGKGLMTEAVNALTRYGFKELGAHRIEIRCEETNTKSRAIAQRLGFSQEAILKNFSLTADNKHVCNTVIYAAYDTQTLPPLEVRW